MQPIQIERQTHETPLACAGALAAQRELAEAQDLFDDPNHGFNRGFADAIDGLAKHRFAFIGHLYFGAGIRSRRRPRAGKSFLPTGMVRIAPGRNVGANRPIREQLDIRIAQVARINRCGGGLSQYWWDGIERRCDFLLVIRMVRVRLTNDQQTGLIRGDLGVIVLFKSRATMRQDPRFGVGEIVLVGVACPRNRRLGRVVSGGGTRARLQVECPSIACGSAMSCPPTKRLTAWRIPIACLIG